MADLTFEEAATPPLPSAGNTRLYVDVADSHLKQIDSGGTVIDLTAAAIDVRFDAQNNTGITLFAGEAVHFDEWDDVNELPAIVKAKANDPALMPAVGLVITDIAAGSAGSVIFQGSLTGLDTSAFLEGQELWVSNVAGGLTNARPTGGTTAIQSIGNAGKISATEGTIVVHGSLNTNDLPNLTKNFVWVGDNVGQPVAVDKATVTGTSPATGLITGGVIAVNGGDPALFDLTAGNGTHVDTTDPNAPVITPVSWTAFTAQTVAGLATDLFTVIGIDSAGAIVQKAGAAFTPAERRDIIVLGSAVHSGNTVIEEINNNPVQTYNVVHGLIDYVLALGGIVNGSEIQLTNTNLTFAQLNGTFTLPYVNAQVDPETPSTVTNATQDPKQFRSSSQDGVGGFITTTLGTSVDPAQYDDGSGTLQTVPNNDWTFQPAYFFGAINALTLVYGQFTYPNKNDALNGVTTDFNDMVIDPILPGSGRLLGFFVLEEGVTDLTNSALADFIPALAGVSGGATGAQTFDQLTDTPASKAAAAGQHTAVNAAGALLEYVRAEIMNSRGHGEPATTGVLTGGMLTQNGLTQVDILAGTGEIVDFYTDYKAPTRLPISWGAQTITIPNLGADTSTFIYFDDVSGVAKTQNTSPSPLDQRTKVVLGFTVNNINTGGILDVVNAPSPVGGVTQAYLDQFEFSGVLADGGQVDKTADPGTNGDLALQVGALQLFSPGINWQNSKSDPNRLAFIAQDPAVWLYALQTAEVVSTGNTLVDPLQYDEGGVLMLVPSTGSGRRTTIQYLFKLVDGAHIMLYGQVVYTDLPTAVAEMGFDFASLVIPQLLQEFAVPLAAIAVTQNCVDVGDTDTAHIEQLQAGGGSGGGAADDPNGASIFTYPRAIGDTDGVLIFGQAAMTVFNVTSRVRRSTIEFRTGDVPAGGAMSIGLYQEDPDIPDTFNRIGISGDFSITTASNQVLLVNIGDVILDPGEYFFAILVPSGGGTPSTPSVSIVANDRLAFESSETGLSTLPLTLTRGAARDEVHWTGLR